MTRACAEQGCGKRPSFGTERGKPVHCKAHKIDDEMDVVSVRCTEPGCSTHPKFGEEWMKPLHCKAHKTDCEYNVVNERCAEPECNKRPSFGTEWKKPVHCFVHKTDDEQNVASKRCEDPGCLKRPKFGTEWGKPVHCATHKTGDELNVVRERCVDPGCHKIPSFGTVWQKPLHCAEHKTVEELDVMSKRCTDKGCDTKPTFGTKWKKPLHCVAHKTQDEWDVVHTRCIGPDGGTCPTNERASYGKHCRYCTDDPAIAKRYKKTETRCLKEIYRLLGPSVTATEQLCVNFSCMDSFGTRAYVDAVLDHPSARVLLEIDECQHSSYPPSCDMKRMHAVVAELRLQSADPRPIAWVRFNPDDGEEPASARDQRRRCGDALKAIRDLIERPRDDIVYVNYA